MNLEQKIGAFILTLSNFSIIVNPLTLLGSLEGSNVPLCIFPEFIFGLLRDILKIITRIRNTSIDSSFHKHDVKDMRIYVNDDIIV